jgi:hypothetical protein
MDNSTPTLAERARAEALEAWLRPAVVQCWHEATLPKARSAVVAGYTDHVAKVLRFQHPPAPGRCGVGIYDRLVVLGALTRLGEDELAAGFRNCTPDVIPVMLCAGTHVAMVYLSPAPLGATVGKGGDA